MENQILRVSDVEIVFKKRYSDQSKFNIRIILIFIRQMIYTKFLAKYKKYIIKHLPGDYCERVIPDPIPNSEVKPFCADGTLS